jgi:hypothetical protein
MLESAFITRANVARRKLKAAQLFLQTVRISGEDWSTDNHLYEQINRRRYSNSLAPPIGVLPVWRITKMILSRASPQGDALPY